MTERIAIIGGGPAGLTAAWWLQRRGFRVSVFEAASHVGGRTRTDVLEGVRVDTGAQLVASMYSRTIRQIRELGLGSDLIRSTGRDALWRDGTAHEVAYGSTTSMLASTALPMRLKLKLGARYLPFLARHESSLDIHTLDAAAAAGLDDESIAEWGERQIGSEFVDLLVYPQLAAYYGVLPEETSAAMYHMLARYGTSVELFALRGGMGRMCDTIADEIRSAGGEVHLDSAVNSIARIDDGLQIQAGEIRGDFRAAVVATPATTTIQLLRPITAELDTFLNTVRYAPAVSLALLLDRPVDVRYFGLSFARKDAGVVGAACVTANKRAGLVPDGRGSLVAFASPTSAADLLDVPARDVLNRMLPELERAFPGLSRSVLRARVYRWAEGSPVFYPGYLHHLAALRAVGFEGASPFVLAGDYLSSPTVEGAVSSGLEAAMRLAQKLA